MGVRLWIPGVKPPVRLLLTNESGRGRLISRTSQIHLIDSLFLGVATSQIHLVDPLFLGIVLQIDMEHRPEGHAGFPCEDREALPATWVNMCMTLNSLLSV